MTDAAPLASEQAANEILISVYRDFISEIFRRLDAVSESLGELKGNPAHSLSWKNCDFCWFQIRKICEYLALAIVAAHHFDDNAINDLKKWRPKELLAEATRLSDHPTPVPIAETFEVGPDGERQLKPISRPIRPEAISAVYGRCSELLHVGSLDRILADKIPYYDISQLEAWMQGFRGLLANHVLLLPGIKKVLLCHSEGEKKAFFILGSDGAIFDTSGLPDFELL